jgi:hypothetical protein
MPDQPVSKCQNCGAPNGHPYCNEDCQEAATAPETATISAADFGPLADITDPWATDARNYL